jgi:hypothetical protein
MMSNRKLLLRLNSVHDYEAVLELVLRVSVGEKKCLAELLRLGHKLAPADELGCSLSLAGALDGGELV